MRKSNLLIFGWGSKGYGCNAIAEHRLHANIRCQAYEHSVNAITSMT